MNLMSWVMKEKHRDRLQLEKLPVPFLPALRLLLLQFFNCSIIHLCPACASSGMVQNVSKVKCLCTDNNQQFLQCFWSAFLPTGKADRMLF